MNIRDRLATTGVRRVRRVFVLVLVGAGIMFTFANPARAWRDQRGEISAARERSAELETQSRDLRARVALLRTDGEVERLGREQYGLVRPGEEAFGILPVTPTPPTVAPPPLKPRSWWQRAWASATFWD